MSTQRRAWIRSTALWAGLGTLAVALWSPPVLAQQDEWEWEPDEGYHREEWYDPSDWFNDDDTIAYEYDAPDVYPYEIYVANGDLDLYDDEWEYGYHYDYVDNEWDWGWHYEYHTDDLDYGWHYDDLTNDWDYGYHYDEFEYYTDDWWRE